MKFRRTFMFLGFVLTTCISLMGFGLIIASMLRLDDKGLSPETTKSITIMLVVGIIVGVAYGIAAGALFGKWRKACNEGTEERVRPIW